MVAMTLYETEADKQKHLSAIRLLAINLGLPEDSIRRLYEYELRSLMKRARIRDFLSVLIIRRIREKIRSTTES
jgi:hypothetical protein